MLFSKYNDLTTYIKRHFASLTPFITIPKAFNITLALAEMKLRKTHCVSKPFIFRIDPCSLCNLRCVNCDAHNKGIHEQRLMDINDFKIIIDKITKYTLRASLYDRGEPLMNKSIYTMVRYARERGISTLISTNFNIFRNEDVDALFNSGLTVLEPCLDGYTQNNYVKYRVGGDVDTIKNGIKTVMEYKRKQKKKWPIVDVQVILFDHIKAEIPLIESFLKQCGVDKITYRQEIRPKNIATSLPKTSKKRCFWLYLGMAVKPDGRVYPCCGQGFDSLSYGNLINEELAEIWNNKYYRFSRSLFSKGENLIYDKEMSRVPCLTCDQFEKQRTMRKIKL